MPFVQKTVFISYRRANFWNALAIYQYLTAQGFDIFFDYKSIKSGDFERVITENIQYRAHFLVVLTPSALDRCDQPNDWLRKEIELAIDEGRNIVPLIFEGFDFGSPSVGEKLVGKLAQLRKYNGLPVYAAYFEAGMKRLTEEFLNVPLDVVLKPISKEMQAITAAQQQAAGEAPKVTREELTAQEWFERGFKATAAEEQIRCYTQAIRLDPAFAYAYNNRGNCYAALGQHQLAIQDFDQAIQIKPDFAQVYYNRGISSADLGQRQRAIQDYDQAIQIDPEDPDYYFNRGLSYAALGQHQRAIEDYDKTIQINTQSANAYYNRGNRYVALGEHQRAIEDFDQAIQIDPKFADAYNNRGLSYAALGQHQRAIQDYDQVIQINPQYANAYYSKASAFGLQGKGGSGRGLAAGSTAPGGGKILPTGQDRQQF